MIRDWIYDLYVKENFIKVTRNNKNNINRAGPKKDLPKKPENGKSKSDC
tara:strand:+ start:174 stop:320 length:147 start_codon:yes stop_codon:yes gene_type:complete